VRQERIGVVQNDYSKLIEQQKKIPEELVSPQKLPEMTDAEYERLGDNYFQQGNYEKAFIQYDKLLQKNPDQPRLVYKRGMFSLRKTAPLKPWGTFRKC